MPRRATALLPFLLLALFFAQGSASSAPDPEQPTAADDATTIEVVATSELVQE